MRCAAGSAWHIPKGGQLVCSRVDREQLRDALVPDVDDLVVHGERVLDLVHRVEDVAQLEVAARGVDVLGAHHERRVVHVVGQLAQRLVELALRGVEPAEVAPEL